MCSCAASEINNKILTKTKKSDGAGATSVAKNIERHFYCARNDLERAAEQYTLCRELLCPARRRRRSLQHLVRRAGGRRKKHISGGGWSFVVKDHVTTFSFREIFIATTRERAMRRRRCITHSLFGGASHTNTMRADDKNHRCINLLKIMIWVIEGRGRSQI